MKVNENSFDKLLDELNALDADTEALAKSFDAQDDQADDDKIKQAADDKGDGDLDDDGTADGADDDGADDNLPMAKSFELELENGEKVEAFDATDLLKSLGSRIENQEQALTKALGLTLSTVKAQGDMIKSLQAEVKTLREAGRGRKTAVTLHDRGAGQEQMRKSDDGAMTPVEFMAKALSAQEQGKLTGLDVARCESYLNRGMDVPADIKAKVLGQ